MTNLRDARDLKAIDQLLQRAVGMRNPRVLAQMLAPAIEHEGLDEATGLSEILEHVPVECAVAAALAGELTESREELPAVIRPHLILDRHQNRTALRPHFPRQDGRRPMLRPRQIDPIAS